MEYLNGLSAIGFQCIWRSGNSNIVLLYFSVIASLPASRIIAKDKKVIPSSIKASWSNRLTNVFIVFIIMEKNRCEQPHTGVIFAGCVCYKSYGKYHILSNRKEQHTGTVHCTKCDSSRLYQGASGEPTKYGDCPHLLNSYVKYYIL